MVKLLDFARPMIRVRFDDEISIRQCNYWEYMMAGDDVNEFVSLNLGVVGVEYMLSRNTINNVALAVLEYSTMGCGLDVLQEVLKQEPNKHVKGLANMVGDVGFYDQPVMMFLLKHRANYLEGLRQKRGR